MPLRILALPVISILLAGVTAGHPISLSSATVDVRDDRIAVKLEVMLEDLVLYHGLQTDPSHRFGSMDLSNAAQKHRQFVLKYLSVLDQSGRRLTANEVQIDTSKIPDDGVAQSELMSHWVVYELQFLLDKPPPFLTFLQTFGGEQAVLPAVMDLMLLQNGILLERPQQLSQGQPYSIKLDWQNPPKKSPRGLAGLRKQVENQRRQRLGIASYGGLHSFIYVTGHEVRHEILVPLLTLERWLTIERQDPEFLEVAEQDAARQQIAEFFCSRNPVDINGRQIPAQLIRMNFFGLNINDFALNAKPRRVSIYQARVGVILSYRADRRPSQVRMRWDTFNQFAQFLRSVVLVGDDDAREHFFRPQETVFQCRGGADEIATLHPVKGSTARISQQASQQVVASLLSNAYRIFDFHSDSEIYDALAISVSGDLLRDLYLQIKRSLVMAEQGGASARVNKVALISSQRLRVSDSEFQTRCRWRVTGTVQHWGHIHTRENEYEALLTVRCSSGEFKIGKMELLNEQQVRFSTRLRGDKPDSP